MNDTHAQRRHMGTNPDGMQWSDRLSWVSLPPRDDDDPTTYDTLYRALAAALREFDGLPIDHPTTQKWTPIIDDVSALINNMEPDHA